MTAAQLRDYVNGLHDFAGVAGLYDFATATATASPKIAWS